MRRFLSLLAVAVGLCTATVAAQDAQRFRIAGLSLGASAANLTGIVGERGFGPVLAEADPRLRQREKASIHLTSVFRRRDGHVLRVGVARTGPPVVRALAYEMAKDVTAYEQIRTYLRGLFGPPAAIHGGDTSVRVAVWEIAGTEMTVEGQRTTVISLIRDPASGHALRVHDVFKRPDFGASPAFTPAQRGLSSPD